MNCYQNFRIEKHEGDYCLFFTEDDGSMTPLFCGSSIPNLLRYMGFQLQRLEKGLPLKASKTIDVIFN